MSTTSRLKLAQLVWLFAAGCQDDAPLSATDDGAVRPGPNKTEAHAGDDALSAHEAGEAGETPSKGASTVEEALPSCGEELDITNPFAQTLDFGADTRPHWLLDAEVSAPDAPLEAIDASYTWEAVTPSEASVRCTLDDCAPGGSRVALRSSGGAPLVLHLYYEEGALPEVSGTVRVVADPRAGLISVSDEAGKLLLGIVRFGGADKAGARKWELADIAAAPGSGVCTARDERCRLIDTAQDLELSVAGATEVLPPGAETTLTLGGARFAAVSFSVLQHGTLAGGDACGVYRAGQDAFSLVRQ